MAWGWTIWVQNMSHSKVDAKTRKLVHGAYIYNIVCRWLINMRFVFIFMLGYYVWSLKCYKGLFVHVSSMCLPCHWYLFLLFGFIGDCSVICICHKKPVLFCSVAHWCLLSCSLSLLFPNFFTGKWILKDPERLKIPLCVVCIKILQYMRIP